MNIRRGLTVSALAFAASALPLRAQALFTPTGFLAPSYRGASGSEYSRWENFFFPYLDPNEADVTSAASNPTIAQVLASSAFITSGINIYTPAEKLGLEVSNDVSGTIGQSGELKNLVFQFETLGTGIDLSTVKLNYLDGSTLKSISALNVISEYRIIVGGFGGFTERVALQWDLTGLGIQDYTISFQSYGSSTSFSAAALDPSTSGYTEVVASARTWDGGAGNNLWSSAANWSGDAVTASGGNVTLGASVGSSLVLDSNREVGELHLSRPGGFSLTPTGGAVLTINTGITADAGGSTNYRITAPIYMGGHNLIDVAAGTSLELANVVSGAGGVGFFPATGIYKSGDGTLLLSANNTFTGGLTVDGGKLIVSGVNQYTNGTSVMQGELIVQADALSGTNNTAVPGALGNTTSNVAVGVDPSTFGSLPEAKLVIDGNHTIARNISLSSGANAKVLAARNTTGPGATFSGTISLTGLTENVYLRAESASSVLNITGPITSSAVGKPITLDGAGTVVFSGVNKSYGNSTVVAAGKLVIASDIGFTGNGDVTVSSGAELLVQGSLSGSGALAVNGGTIGGSGTINRPFTLDNGDVLSPGNSPGTLHTVSETWGAGATLKLEIKDSDAGIGIGWDNLSITGSLSLTATSANKFKLELYSLTALNEAGQIADFNPNTSRTWQFLTASDGITGFDASAFEIGLGHFQNSLAGSFSVTTSGDGKSLSVQYLAVPEPSTSLLALCGATFFFHRRRRTTRNC
jgi:autotransporter-associated beta strand protein